jgi:uncharacterized pyridoxamine 5'-phosphate oxidase family protein
MSEDMKKEVWGHFKKMQNVFLATCDKAQPRVRPVTLIHHDKKCWVGTGTGDAKVGQIRDNEKVEFCLFLRDEKSSGYIRACAQAVIVENSEIRKTLSEQMPYFKEFWKSPDDPAYTLLQLVIKEIEYMKPGLIKVERFTV